MAGWLLGGWRLAALGAAYIGFIVLSGWWTEAMVTTYLVFVAVVICVIFGFPIGVWASRHDGRTRAVAFLCDTLQTFPSFIYLIPVVMLFQVGTISQIMAIVVYASIPVVRYTYVGLRAVPHDIVEAAISSGCTPSQILWKVRMPLAFPEIMLGLNQTIMFGLFMVMIAGFIGGNYDLAREIFQGQGSKRRRSRTAPGAVRRISRVDGRSTDFGLGQPAQSATRLSLTSTGSKPESNTTVFWKPGAAAGVEKTVFKGQHSIGR